MTTQRPRLSVLSLFDPLSSSSSSRFSSSTDSNKENDCNDFSFFHSQKQAYSPVRKLCRRLIDVGDVTVDEPDIRNLLQEEEEELDAEIKQSLEDENATLTFRDMAKAATPKWSARRAATWATPKMSPTPRTPLAEIAPTDEITPIGRKKTFRRPMPSVSKAHQTNAVTSSDATPPALRNLINVQECSTSLAMPVPTIEISCDTETSNSQYSSKSLGETTAALELSCSTLISDTPVFVSPSSLRPTPESAVGTSPQLFESRLRPNAHLKDPNNTDRHSVDLHTSFQLHFNSSEATFDLLNDKISFFGSNSGMDLCEGTSFDDDGFGPTCHESVNDTSAGEQEALSSKRPIDAHGFGTPNETRFESQNNAVTEGRHASMLDAICIGIKDRTTSKIATPPTPVCKKSSIPNSIDEPPMPPLSSSEPAGDTVSTPSSRPTALAPPRPVAALKVIKRAKTVDQAKLAGSRTNPGGSRRTSTTVPASQVPAQSSLEKVSSILTCKVTENSQGSGRIRRAVNKGPVVSSGSQSGDGPRRVLVNDGPKLKLLNTKGQTNSTQVTLGGPRRIPASESGNTTRPPRSTLNIVNPARCATWSLAAGSTAIPRPVNRNSGSKIPAPSGGKQRFGVQIEPGPNKGLLGRRAT